MASRDLNELLGPVKAKATAMLDACSAVGLDILITCTYRTDAEQSALYAQGRSPLAVANQLRLEAGLSAITENENLHKVTNARPGQSLHSMRRAIDVVPIVGGKPVWSADNPVWIKVGKIGKKCGFEWGGDWRTFREYPHFQDTAELDGTPEFIPTVPAPVPVAEGGAMPPKPPVADYSFYGFAAEAAEKTLIA